MAIFDSQNEFYYLHYTRYCFFSNTITVLLLFEKNTKKFFGYRDTIYLLFISLYGWKINLNVNGFMKEKYFLKV